MVFRRSNVRAVRNGCARTVSVQIPTQKFGKGFFRVAGDNHCAVHTAKRNRLRRQRSCAVYRTAVQFVGYRIGFTLPNGIQGMVFRIFRNNAVFGDGVALTVCFRVPTNKGITFIFHFNRRQRAIRLARRNLDIVRVIHYRTEVQIEPNGNRFRLRFLEELTTYCQHKREEYGDNPHKKFLHFHHSSSLI